jgi:hypothetical protein
MSDQSGQFTPSQGYGQPPGRPDFAKQPGPAGNFQAPAPAGYGPAPAISGYGPPGHQTLGPVGSPRSIGSCIGLAIITLGIYTYVWTWKTHDEIKRHSGVGVGGPVGFLLYFVFSPVTYFLLPGEVRQMLARAGRPSQVQGTTGFWILLPLVGPIVWFVKVQGQLNEYWRSLGATG